MGTKFNLSETELLIMEFMWKENREMTLGELSGHFKSLGYNWAYQTIKSFLSRLIAKGAVDFRKEGHKNIYKPSMTKESYGSNWLKIILMDNFGDIKNGFTVALGGVKKQLSPEQQEELRRLWDE